MYWDKYGLQKVFLKDKGMFVFNFSSAEERDNVLALGPWYISNKLLIIQKWKEGLDVLTESCTKAPVWVKFHHVPLSYWTPKRLSYLTSGIGKPFFVDKITEKLELINFARICVEISSTSALPDKLDVVVLNVELRSEKVVEVRVEYQNKPQFCLHRKSFGHSILRCLRANYQRIPNASGKAHAEPCDHDHGILMSDENGIMASAPPDHPVPQFEENWTVVSKGPKFAVSPAVIKDNFPLAIKNSFLLISLVLLLPEVGSSGVGSSPNPSPLVDKLKLVDEKDSKEHKIKAKDSSDLS